MSAVESTFYFNKFVSACKAAGESKGTHSRFSSCRNKTKHIDTWIISYNLLCQYYFKFYGSPIKPAFIQLRFNGFLYYRMIMPKYQRAVSHTVINVLIIVNVPYFGTIS